MLGESFVAAATELALLLADTSDDVVEDWLDGMMTQQDLAVVHIIAEEEGPECADRLYRGQYAAMLVSPAVHKIGDRIRPEILVHEALCQLEDVEHISRGIAEDLDKQRLREARQIGPIGQALISAVG